VSISLDTVEVPALAPPALKAKLTPEQFEEAWLMRARGAAYHTIAQKIGSTRQKVEHDLNKWRQPPRADSPPLPGVYYNRWLLANPQHRPPEPEPEVEDLNCEDPTDTLPDDFKPPAHLSRDEQKSFLSEIARSTQAEGRRLIELGVLDEARKVMTLGIAASKELSRLQRDDGDQHFIRISKEELAERAVQARAVLTNHLKTGRPLLCSDCGRKLSISWGRGE
jgi:hypothetical protein